MELSFLILVLLFVSLGAAIKGLAGFGFGVAGMALLSNFIPAQDAVTVMILPLLAVNLPLIFEADLNDLKSCLKKFHLFISLSLIGTLVGVSLVNLFSGTLLTVIIGLISLFYVYSKTGLYLPQTLVDKCLRKNGYVQMVVGTASGMVFGISNIGLPFVTYLEGIETDRKTFAGVLSLLIFSATALRIGVSLDTGLYTQDLFIVSILAALLGLLVSKIGVRLSQILPDRFLNYGVLFLITLAAIRLLATSLIEISF